MKKRKDRVYMKELAKELGVAEATIRGWKFHKRYTRELPLKKDLNGNIYCTRAVVTVFKREWL